MNVEIGTEAAQFLKKECINGVFVAVHCACGKVRLLAFWEYLPISVNSQVMVPQSQLTCVSYAKEVGDDHCHWHSELLNFSISGIIFELGKRNKINGEKWSIERKKSRGRESRATFLFS